MLIEKETLSDFSKLVRENKVAEFKSDLKVGVDLGTANIVISVVDKENNPVAGMTCESKVVRDGIVVDFIGAINILKKMKEKLEKMLSVKLINTATAIPPGILEGNIKCISNVIESAGFEVVNVVDEPTAASTVLNLKNAAVVDVGGGTTGISILKDGKVIYTADEPTGGIHMTLVIAGYYGCSLEEAEIIKKDKEKEEEIFEIIRPVVEKMASIVKRFLESYEVPEIYVVGGAASFKGFERVFEKFIGIKTIKTNDSLFVTPLGIAMNCN